MTALCASHLCRKPTQAFCIILVTFCDLSINLTNFTINSISNEGNLLDYVNPAVDIPKINTH